MKAVLALAALGTGPAFASLGCVADGIILFPPTGQIATGGARRVIIPLTDGACEAFVVSSRAGVEPEAFVLRFYGNADRADRHVADEARGFGDASLEFWGVNYPGYGTSGGKATLRGVAASALAAYDAVAKVAQGRPIFAFGTSLGTTAALAVAARRNVAGLVLTNPPPLPQLIRGAYGWWNLWLLATPVSWSIPDELDSLANARKAHAPAVFISSENDSVVPPEYQHMVYEAYAGTKVTYVLPGAGHNDPVPTPIEAKVHERVLTILRERAASPAK